MFGRYAVRIAVLTTIFVASFTAFCLGIEVAPEPIDQPIPSALRAPLSQFLRDLGISDVEETLAHSKGGKIRGGKSELLVFRIENRCVPQGSDDCFTIIGHIVDGRFTAEAMFVAGPRMNWGDVAPTFFGLAGFPLRFYGKTNIVVLLESPAGWVVAIIPQPTPPI
jgi:hypothetical protein